MKKIVSIAVAVLCLGSLSAANAATISLISSIDGAQAGTTSGTTGSATMTYDDVSGLFSWEIMWGALEGDVTVAHFHGPAPAGVSAGVEVNFGAISGLSSPSIGSAVISSAQAADLLAGLWYINIHSTFAPGGEIRGQVQVIPVPAALWLFLSGLGVIGLRRLS